MRLASLLCLATLLPTIATADEMWNTPYGYISWEDTRGDVAVFRQMGDDGMTPGSMRLFVPFLPADMMGGRGVYFGYWTDTTPGGPCLADLIDATGNKTANWGRLSLSFLEPEFPSGWAALTGYCFEEPTQPLNATPAFGVGD